ncbi:galactokinase [Hydromonas duriensis]|nr:galactokinase [Hydromonas duriensis]
MKNSENLLQHLQSIFQQQFDAKATHAFFAPGRVNLIGEHIDYNGGHVFPCALNVGTYALVRVREDKRLRMYSDNFSALGVLDLPLNALLYDEKNDWANYPAGVFKMMLDDGAPIEHGLDILFFGDIPNGAGLSSSASIELVTAVLVNHMFELNWPQIELVKLSQRAENQFNGMNCGIMDQFASGMGRAMHAMQLNTHTLDFQYVPLDLGAEHTLLIANTNKRRELSDSKYNERRAECDAALAALQTVLPIKALCELSLQQFEHHADVMTNTTQRQRALHAVAENQRTLEAVNVLKSGDIAAFGRLMNASHVSLRDLYEVTGEHLDALVDAAWTHGAVGARMTGAGFGGCTVMIVKTHALHTFKAQVNSDYQAKTGLSATFYDVSIGEGARFLGAV